MMWMVMMRTRVCVWARINYGRSNQVIMQSRQQPSGKKLITAPDRREAGGVGWWGRRRRLVEDFLELFCLLIYNSKYRHLNGRLPVCL